MDGIDVAMIETDGLFEVRRGPGAEFTYDIETRKQIEQGLVDAHQIEEDRTARPGNLERLEKRLSELHAGAVNTFLSDNSIDPQDVDLIGFHGQTVLHRPQDGLTVQLGDGKLLAEQTGIEVVCDMRASDMAAGGEGAPLVPVYHQALAGNLPDFVDQKKPIAFVNIGGISNITFIPGNGDLIAFDTGPGNALLDQWMQKVGGIPFDQGGNIAAEGGVVAALLQHYLASPYFQAKPPKSLDRNDFLPPSANEAELSDGARTLARLTAGSIIKAAEHLSEFPELWIICGGGRKNRMIMADLKELAGNRNARIISAEEAGFDGDAMEAEAFAYLAVRSVKQLPLTFPATTGCRTPVTGGVLYRAISKLAR